VLIKEHKVKWVHLLGMSGPSEIPLMAWLGRYALVTCDSSSQHEGSRHRKYYYQNVKGKLRTFQLGDQEAPQGFSRGSTLPCSCPACHGLQFRELYHLPEIKNGRLGAIMGMHNMLAIRRYANAWASYALETDSTGKYVVDHKTYRDKVKEIYGEDKAIMLDYIECALEVGVNEAQRDARWWTNEPLKRGLYAGEDRDSEEGPADTHIPGTNLEIIPWYLDLNNPKILRTMPKSVQYWWEENRGSYD
jgi:hypothetical protein